MARGYPGAFGRKLNAPYVWLPLCVLFLAPFIDVRRPLRLLHLDLLVLLGFGVSHVFFNRGEIGVSTPLVYPVLLYLLARVLFAGFRPRRAAGPLVPHAPLTLLVVGLVFLIAFRVGLNVADSNVIDVGYAGVVGADRIVDGDQLYGEGFSGDVQRGDTYGPVNYLLYVPFEQALPWSGRWDDLPAAHGAAISFDLLVIGGLLLLGRRLRRGPRRERTRSGACLRLGGVSLYGVRARVELERLAGGAGLRGHAARREPGAGLRSRALERGGARPRVRGEVRERSRWPRCSPAGTRRVFFAALLLVLVAMVAPFVPDGGLRELYDRTIGYQASRPSPFSIWGQVDSLDWLQTALKVAAAGLALLVAFVPRRIDLRQIAALGAAVLIAIQLTATHWFYLYVVWFVPFVLVAPVRRSRSAAREPAAEDQSRARAGARVNAPPRVSRAHAIGALALLVAGWALTLWVAPWSDERVNDLFVYRGFAEPRAATAGCPTATSHSSTRRWRRR